MKPELGAKSWAEIDHELSQSFVLNAVRIYREAAVCGIAEAKQAVGTRFRSQFPELYTKHHDVMEKPQANS